MSTATQHRRTFAIPCSAPGCKAWTSDQAPATDWVTAQAAVHAATLLGWIHARSADGKRLLWVCPKHQVWDPARGRWVRA